jgi:hypothetical protein
VAHGAVGRRKRVARMETHALLFMARNAGVVCRLSIRG